MELITSQIPIWIPIVSAFIGAIIGSLITYQANSHIEQQKTKLQAYSKLKGRKRAIAQIYFSLFEAKLRCARYSIFKEMLGTPSDPAAYDDYIRCVKMESDLSTEITKYYENLLEIIVMIEISFKRTPELKNKVDLIEILNESVNDQMADKIDQFEDRLREALSSIPFEREIKSISSGHFRMITRYDARVAISLTDRIIKEMEKEISIYINTNIEWPIDDLLFYLKRELDGEDNEALQAWRIQISP